MSDRLDRPSLDPRMTHIAMTQEQEAAYEAMDPPLNVDVPYVGQEGSVLSCTMGNWTGEPSHYSYEWFIDNMTMGPGPSTVHVDQNDVGKTAYCIVSAGNAKGIVAAPPSNEVVIEGPPQEDAAA